MAPAWSRRLSPPVIFRQQRRRYNAWDMLDTKPPVMLVGRRASSMKNVRAITMAGSLQRPSVADPRVGQSRGTARFPAENLRLSEGPVPSFVSFLSPQSVARPVVHLSGSLGAPQDIIATHTTPTVKQRPIAFTPLSIGLAKLSFRLQ